MNYDKHTDEVLERLQAHQIIEILNTANQSIGKALESIQEIVDDMNALHLHLHFLQSAKTFAKQEIKEIGFYLN